MMSIKRCAILIALALFMCVGVANGSAAQAKKLVLPKGLITVEEEAFYQAKSLEVVVLPEGMKNIESRAFAESSLKAIILPNTIERIAEDAFEGCNVGLVAQEGSYAYLWGEEQGMEMLATKIQLQQDLISIKKSTSQVLPPASLNGLGTIVWSTSDSNIVRISDDMSSIKGIKFGEVVLTASLWEKPDVCASIIVRVIPNNPGLVTYTGTIQERFNTLKKQFPNGKYWNNCEYFGIFDPNTYTSKECTVSDHQNFRYCGYFGNGSECWGFADRIAYGLFGSYPDSGYDDGWVYTTQKSAVDKLEPGDWVRIGGHSFVVWKVSGSDVYCVEANWGGRCQITWDVVRTKESIKASLTFIQKNPEGKYTSLFKSKEELSQPTFEYLVEDGNALITNVDIGFQKEWVVPDTIDGYPIIGFAEDFVYDEELDEYITYDFKNAKYLERVKIGKYWEGDRLEYLASCVSKEIIVSEENQRLCAVDGVLYSKDMTVMYAYPYEKTDTTYLMPDTVKQMGEIYCRYLQKIVFSPALEDYEEIPYLTDGIEVPEENPYYASYNGGLYTKDMKKILYIPETEIYQIAEGTETCSYNLFNYTIVDDLVFPASFKKINGVVDLYNVFFDGCTVSYDGWYFDVNKAVFLNGASIAGDDADIEIRYVYAETGTDAERLAEMCDATFYDLKLKLNKSACTLEAGSSTYLSAAMEGITQTKKRIMWHTSDEKIAVVNDSGKVTAVSKGTAMISASVDGQYMAECKVVVK